MGLEETDGVVHAIPHPRCTECGARLTEREQQTMQESGGLALCAIHAAELTPLGHGDPYDAGL